MIRNFITSLILISILLLSPFAFAAKIKSSWRNPSATATSLQFTKVLVIVTIKHEMTRKVAEDEAVRIINRGGRAQAVPSYSILSMEELADKDLAKSKIDGMGFDGVVLMEYAGSEDRSRYKENVAEWATYNFWGYYNPVWGGFYSSKAAHDTRVFIETKFFSLKENNLIWAGTSEVKNPKNPADVVADIAKEVAKYLQKEGLIAKPK